VGEHEFDHQKWSFWLVAGVITWLLLMCAEFLTVCLVWPSTHPGCAENAGRFNELLGTILASVLAFAAGRSTK
jgi:hypothetical protein